jgi:hypothetical protein
MARSRSAAVWGCVLIAAAIPALSRPLQAGEAPAGPSIRAARSTGAIHIDGKLDDPAWRSEEPFDAFVQRFPVEGGRPGERTEVRVLYDGAALYVGVTCHDSSPAEIVMPLGRRDSPPVSDLVRVYVDSNGDGRTAALFVLTAGGVMADALVFDDDQTTYDWDAVWEGASAILPGGWSAEFAIPLAILRYPSVPEQAWGFGVQREIGRTHERSADMFIPRNARGLASRLGRLEALEGLEAHAGVEVAPYTVGRVALRPQYSDPAKPTPRLAEPVANAGVDFRLRFGPQLALTGTVNPDFGQVEADQIILNLSNFEYQFPEKRPFFTQGLDLFKPVGDGNEQPPQQLFYSRRIGLDAPILGAAKLVGRVGTQTQIGVLAALVSGTEQVPGATEAAPDWRLRWTPAQPLQLAPGLAYPLQSSATRRFLASVARATVTPGVVVGAMGTSAVPAGPSCTDADLAGAGGAPARCSTSGGNALALDLNATSADREWYAYGQVVGSQVVGGPPTRILPDGVSLARGDLGFGSYLRAGRRGGEPWRVDASWTYATPRLQLDAAGYLRTQNVQKVATTVTYARPNGGARTHDHAFWLTGWSQWTTDGAALSRGYGATAGVDALLRSPYLGVHCQVEYAEGRFDVRDVKRGRGSSEGAGIPEELPGWVQPTCTVETDPARPLSASITAYGGKEFSPGPLRQPWYSGASLSAGWRPHPRADTKLAVAWDYNDLAVKYVDGVAPGPLLLGELVAPSLSVTLRQTFVATPRLTFQLHAQVFAAYGAFGPFYSAAVRGTEPIRIRDLERIDPRTDPAFASSFQDPDFKDVTFVVNALARWEYRPGCILYLVYARNQSAAPYSEADPERHSLVPARLPLGPTWDSLLLKLTYLFRA